VYPGIQDPSRVGSEKDVLLIESIDPIIEVGNPIENAIEHHDVVVIEPVPEVQERLVP
jgi:hypothetical protein